MRTSFSRGSLALIHIHNTNTAGATVAGSVVAAALTGLCQPGAGSPHTRRGWRTSPLILFSFPISCFPSNVGKKLPSQWGRMIGVGERWLSQSVFVPAAREPDEILLIISGTRDAKLRTDLIPILSIKLGTVQSYWKALQWWKIVFKIALLQTERFSLSVFCHPANCFPSSYILHNELLSPNVMAGFALEGSLI